MEIDVEALQMLEGDEPVALERCAITCAWTCSWTMVGGE